MSLTDEHTLYSFLSEVTHVEISSQWVQCFTAADGNHKCWTSWPGGTLPYSCASSAVCTTRPLNNSMLSFSIQALMHSVKCAACTQNTVSHNAMCFTWPSVFSVPVKPLDCPKFRYEQNSIWIKTHWFHLNTHHYIKHTAVQVIYCCILIHLLLILLWMSQNSPSWKCG